MLVRVANGQCGRVCEVCPGDHHASTMTTRPLRPLTEAEESTNQHTQSPYT